MSYIPDINQPLLPFRFWKKMRNVYKMKKDLHTVSKNFQICPTIEGGGGSLKNLKYNPLSSDTSFIRYWRRNKVDQTRGL